MPYWCWIVGVDPEAMRKGRSERQFYLALAVVICFLSVASGLATTIAAGYWLDRPATSLWWIGIAWTLFMALGVEPLVLQVAATRKPLQLLIASVPRVLVSLLVTFQIAEMVILSFNAQTITSYLGNQHKAAAAAVRAQLHAEFDPRIAMQHDLVNTMRGQETWLAKRVERDRFLSQLAKTEEYREHYAQLQLQAQARLDAARERHAPRFVTAGDTIARLTDERDTEITRRIAQIRADHGLTAREKALSALRKQDATLDHQVWYLRAFFLVLDLLPLTLKLARVLTVKSPLDDIVEAQRERERVNAFAMQEAAKTERERIAEQGRADRDVNSADIQTEADERIADAYGDAPAPRGHRRGPAGRVSGYSLGDFVDHMSAHESVPVEISRELRRAGLVGAALILGLAALMGIVSPIAHLSGMWLVAIMLGLVALLAAWTRGFRRAPAWGLRATFATLIAGLALPVVILALNV
jgi:hypothetical protein